MQKGNTNIEAKRFFDIGKWGKQRFEEGRDNIMKRKQRLRGI